MRRPRLAARAASAAFARSAHNGGGPSVQSLLAHAGCEVDSATGALTPPLHLSTTFVRDPDLEVENGYPRGYVYARANNPTRDLVERTLANLEGGTEALAFSSGMAAVSAVVQALLRPGDCVLLPDDAYHGVRALLASVYGQWGVRHRLIDMSSAVAVRSALADGAALCWLETPSNPMLKLSDLGAISALCHEAGVPCVVDATWCTPVLLRPLEHGADLVVHSCTKYLGGHSDLTGGVVIGGARAEASGIVPKLRQVQQLGGAVAAPFDSWLLLRGLRSLAARMPLHCSNALAVATMLSRHPRVSAVHYPGLDSHPQHALALESMPRGFGGMLSFQCRGGASEALRVAASTELFTRATSLGGTESLIEHRASIEAPPTETPDDLLRVSCGLEHPADLVADLERALG